MKLYRELYSYSIKKGTLSACQKLHPNFLVASSSNLHPLQATSTNSSPSLHDDIPSHQYNVYKRGIAFQDQ